MTTFDRDDDVRRQESDELHGIAGCWFHRPPNPDEKVAAARTDCIVRRWTEEDRHRAVVLASVGFSTEDIARDLGRTKAAVEVYFSNVLRLKPSKLAGVIV